jgi:hypothetical protein
MGGTRRARLGTLSKGIINVKALLPLTILLLLSGCGITEVSSGPYTPQGTQPGGGGTPSPPTPPTPPIPPPAKVNPTGIWDMTDTVNGNPVSEVALIANGMYFALAATDQFGCPDITGGNYTISGATFTGSGVTSMLVACPNAPSNYFSWTLTGYLTNGALNLSFDDAGTLTPTMGATLDALYNETSSLAKLVGNWDDNGNTLTVDPDGTFFEQQASGCVVNGAYTILNPAHNLYGVSFEFSNCTSSLAGIPFTGLGYLDDSNPNSVHFLEDASGPDAAEGGATMVVYDNITPQ